MFADVLFSTEGLVIIGALLSALTVVIGILWKRGEADKAAMLKEKDDQINSWKQIAKDGNKTLGKVVDTLPADKIVKALPLEPVHAESSSPPTKAQKDTAELATERALLTAHKLSLGIRAAPELKGTQPETFQAGRTTQ
jgi:hypothetical protein